MTDFIHRHNNSLRYFYSCCIIGFGTFTNELGETETRAFLLESVPEPSTIMGLLAVGILGFTQLRTLKK